MKLVIKSAQKIKDLQDSFSEMFQFLKIEFFSRPHRKGSASAKKDMIQGVRFLSDLKGLKKEGSIEIIPTMTVGELESLFSEQFGLSIQVFRKSGKVWLETSVTDHWTLQEQNMEGEDLSV